MERTTVAALARQLLANDDRRPDRPGEIIPLRGALASGRLATSAILPVLPATAPGGAPVEGSGRLAREPDRRERLGRGVVVLLFIAVVFLGGVFVGASLTGSRRQPAPSKPAEMADGGRRPSVKVAASEPAAAVQAAPPAVAAPAADAPGATKLTAAEIEALMARGDARLRDGDVMAARALYQTCAVAGDGTAALRLGQTFDPAFLDRTGLRRANGDPGQAAYWYRRGQELGNAEAAYLLRETEIAARSRWSGNIRLPAQPVERRRR